MTKTFRDEPFSPREGNGPTALPSTAAQDENRCGLLKLSENVRLETSPQSFWHRQGLWRTSQGGELGQWRQNLFSQDPQTFHLDAAAGAHPSIRAELRSAEDLASLYNVKPLQGPAMQREDKSQVTMALTDCDGELLFILREIAGGLPTSIEVYGRDGRLLATTLVDLDRPLLRFVDPEMRLIATAESPSLGANLTLAALRDVPSEAGIYPWEVHFEKEPYSNSSQLLKENLRWVVATAVQVRAIRDATRAAQKAGEEPSYITGREWYTGSMSLVAVLCVGLLLGSLFLVFRLVYPLAVKNEITNTFLKIPVRPVAVPGAGRYIGQPSRVVM